MKIVNRLSVLKLLQLLNGVFFLRSKPTAVTNPMLVHNSEIPNSEIREGCPSLKHLI